MAPFGRSLLLGACAAGLAAWPAGPLAAQLDPTGRWRTLETAHFDVHARAAHRELALRAAGEAEAAYDAYVRLLPAPRSRIDLVVADNVDEPNGYATSYPRPRIVIYAVPPAGDLQLAAYDRWLRLVITHELAHVFHLDLGRGWWQAARSLLGRAPFLFPDAYTPPWMREGLAVFYESRLTGAGRLEGGYLRAVVAAAAGEGDGMRLDEASTASPRWPSGLRAYAFGSRFMDAAARRLGDSVVARYAVAVAGRPLPYLQLAPAWRQLAGLAIEREWDDAVRGSATPRVASPVRGTLPEDPPPRVVRRGWRSAVQPRMSADGTRLLAVEDDGRDATHLVEVRREDGVVRRLARVNGANGLAWMPDGGALVSQLDYRGPYQLRSDLWTVAPGGRERRLTSAARLREADQAPDGAIVAVRVVPGGTALILAGPGAGAPEAWRALTAAGPGIEWATPRFSPDGGLIAAVRVERGRHDIVLLDRDGSLVRQVTQDRDLDLTPAFSPDGRWLVWSRELDGVPQIVGLPLTGDTSGGARRFTDEPYAAWMPAPASDSLFYLAYHADGFALVAVPLSGRPWTPGEPRAPDGPAPALPAAALRAEHGYRALASAAPRFWLPQLFAEPGGSWAGAFTASSDALERHSYGASLMLGFGALWGRWNARLDYRYAGPGSALVDLSASHDPRLAPGGGCCDPDDEVHAGLTMVRRRWRWQAQGRVGTEYTRTLFAERVGVSLSGALSRTITPPLSVSTQSGARLVATLRYRHRTSGSLASTEFTVRTSLFEDGPARRFARRVFALRGAFGQLRGGDPIEFAVGGVAGGTFGVLPGIAVGSGSRTFPVRGLAPGAISGRRVAGASAELREPLALIGRGLGLFPLGLDRLSATLFADGAVAWAPRYCPSYSPSMPSATTSDCGAVALSFGPELSSDVVLGFDVPVRFRAGWAVVVTSTGAGAGAGTAAYVGIGSSF